MSKLDRIPLWLRKQRLVPGTYAPVDVTPTEHDIDVFVAAICDVDARGLKTRFEVPVTEIMASIRTVRDAIKLGKTPEVITREHAWIVPLIAGEPIKAKGSNWLSRAIVHEPVSEPQMEAISHITDQPYAPIDRASPAGLADFLAEMRARYAEAAGPLTLRRLAESVAKGSPSAVTQSREFLFGKSSGGPSVAIQQNFGGGNSPAQGVPERSLPAFQFERVIMGYEAEHPDNSGEVTQFNESLLEGQEEE